MANNKKIDCSKKAQENRIHNARQKAETEYRKKYAATFLLFNSKAIDQMKSYGTAAANHQREIEAHRCKKK